MMTEGSCTSVEIAFSFFQFLCLPHFVLLAADLYLITCMCVSLGVHMHGHTHVFRGKKHPFLLFALSLCFICLDCFISSLQPVGHWGTGFTLEPGLLSTKGVGP